MSQPKSSQIFFAAARDGRIEEIRRLVEKDPELATVGDPECFNYSLLNYGAWKNRRDYIDLALQSGADMNELTEFWAGDWTALQHALNYGNREIAEYLVERGARIDVHAAAGLPRLELLRDMLSRNPELVHERGGDGQTPLHFAQTPAVVDLLLKHGADIEARDVDHYSTPAQWAAANRPQIARYLVALGATPDIFMACALLDLDLLRALIEAEPETLRERVSLERFPPPQSTPKSVAFTSSIPPWEQTQPLCTSQPAWTPPS